MPYSNNPNIPKVRMKAVDHLYQGWSVRKTARHFGVHPSTVSRWNKKDCCYGLRPIPTENSKPFHHPNQLTDDVVEKIVELRLKHNRCAEVVHQELINLGIVVSLSSVKRTLERKCLIKKRSSWKRYHSYLPRIEAQKPGDLVQIDTIHIGPCDENRLYIYTILDVFSRWAWADVKLRINTHNSFRSVKMAQKSASFSFSNIQSDHGQEFSSWFSGSVKSCGLTHRHSRIRKPSDNGHLERFNRTIQEECLDRIPQSLWAYKKAIPEYLDYYNNERLHLGLQLKTPQQVLRSY